MSIYGKKYYLLLRASSVEFIGQTVAAKFYLYDEKDVGEINVGVRLGLKW